jgi:threonine dehydrogenase-like Zn-dependent dehydrogenase
MARVLIVGCGCRGQALAGALAAEGHAVRATTRAPARAAELTAAGIEVVVADPDRLVTMMPAIEGVSVVCWLMGTAGASELHGPRLESMLEHIVDTPARGLVYETGGVERPEGVAAAERLSAVYSMPVEVVREPPGEHAAWLAAVVGAVGRVLTA